MPSVLNAINVNRQSNMDVVQTENLGNIAGNLNHLEMLYWYTLPGIAISIAQREALYREYLHAQMKQCGNGQRVDQADSQSGNVAENPGNQGQTAVQNFAPPSLLPPMQSHRPPIPVLAPSISNIFVSDP